MILTLMTIEEKTGGKKTEFTECKSTFGQARPESSSTKSLGMAQNILEPEEGRGGTSFLFSLYLF